MNYREKIAKLREKMKENELDAYIVYAFDPHRSIAIADHWKTVQWLTGFTGWVCTLALTMDKEAFWTDGRYMQQAERELKGTGITRYCISDASHPDYISWLINELKPGSTIGLDGRVITAAEFSRLEKVLGRRNIQIDYEKDLVGQIWNDRPSIPLAPLFELELRFAGKSRVEKLIQVREKMEADGADYYLMSGLDDIAWLTNLRGGDSDLYPIFHAYMIVGMKQAVLFTILEKLSNEIQEALLADGIEVRKMGDVTAYLNGLPSECTVFFDPFKIGLLLRRAFPESVFPLEGLDIVTGIKCCKNDIEQKNIRFANIKESVAFTRLIKYIKENVGKTPLDEYMVGQWINTERQKVPEYIKAANVPIVGCKANAVQLHYRPTKGKSDQLPSYGFVLIDLCAHYLFGSTDITRTVALGPLTEKMKQDYTFTLKTHIRLATQKFLYGTTGPALDSVIKSLHWNEGLNYGAGTGHGIGYCSYIQEGPCKIAVDASPYFNYMFETPIEPGMLFSNEPGVYREGSHAIRLENSILAKDYMTNEYGRFLEFETVTYVPFEPQAIVPSMLSEEEQKWYNEYQKKCYELISPYLTEEERQWLRNETRPVKH